MAFCFDLRAVAVPFVLRNVASTRCLRVGNGCRKARADRGHTMWMGLGVNGDGCGAKCESVK